MISEAHGHYREFLLIIYREFLLIIYREFLLIKIVTAQSIVNGAPMSAARIPSKTGKPFFFPVEMY
ncbi:hypothetical protein, partial [Methanosarcina mazei]